MERVGIRIPKPMTDEMSRIIKQHPELCYNRQQFVESAIREKLERIKMTGHPTKAENTAEEDFLLIFNEESRKRVAKIYLREIQGLVDMGHVLSLPEVQQALKGRKLKIKAQSIAKTLNSF